LHGRFAIGIFPPQHQAAIGAAGQTPTRVARLAVWGFFAGFGFNGKVCFKNCCHCFSSKSFFLPFSLNFGKYKLKQKRRS
jgi:hypothetical protein